MPFPISNSIKISALFLFLSFSLLGKGFRVTNAEQDSIVKMSGYVYDTIINRPDTLLLKAKIILESIPHGNEVGIISSDEKGHYEYFANMAYTYSINVVSENHRKHSEVLNPRMLISGNEIIKNFYLEPELKENQVIRLDKLIFEQGKAAITSVSYQELNRLVSFMNQYNSMQIQLEGHTDYRGNKKLNMDLSKDRVTAVKSYLVGKGIQPGRIKTKAYGGTMPLVREQSIEASEINRRVEVRILKLK
jgi:OmpA-OmpF porin, OOP family